MWAGVRLIQRGGDPGPGAGTKGRRSGQRGPAGDASARSGRTGGPEMAVRPRPARTRSPAVAGGGGLFLRGTVEPAGNLPTGLACRTGLEDGARLAPRTTVPERGAGARPGGRALSRGDTAAAAACLARPTARAATGPISSAWSALPCRRSSRIFSVPGHPCCWSMPACSGATT